MFAEALSAMHAAAAAVQAETTSDPMDLYLAAHVYRAAVAPQHWQCRLDYVEAKGRYLQARLVEDPAAAELRVQALAVKRKLLEVERFIDGMVSFCDEFEEAEPDVVERALEPMEQLARLKVIHSAGCASQLIRHPPL
jgi:hypothetical protein